MSTQELSPIIDKTELIKAFLRVIETTSPALSVVFSKYLFPHDSERSLKLQATLQIETFTELLTLWAEGLTPAQQAISLPYFLGILEHHLTEKGTDDFLQFDKDGSIPLMQPILNYNVIASNLASGEITLKEAISEASTQVATPDLRNLETDLKILFDRLNGNPSLGKKIGKWLYDLRYSFRLDRKNGEMSLRKALENPNKFIMNANLQAIDSARKSIDELDQKTNGRLNKIVKYTQRMLVARYMGGNKLLENINTQVDSALILGTDTVLIGFTYGEGILAQAAADPELLTSIENDQDNIIEAMTLAARVIREMNDASPTALTIWGEERESVVQELEWLRQQIGPELSPREFFIELGKLAEMKPELRHYADSFARQVVDAKQGEYNIGLSASVENTSDWESFYFNMDFMAVDYSETRPRLLDLLNNINPRVADFIGRMVGYHDGLYRSVKSDFDAKSGDLTTFSARNWRTTFDRRAHLAMFVQMKEKALEEEQDEKVHLLSRVIRSLSHNNSLAQ